MLQELIARMSAGQTSAIWGNKFENSPKINALIKLKICKDVYEYIPNIWLSVFIDLMLYYRLHCTNIECTYTSEWPLVADSLKCIMMASWNGNIFCVTGHLCGEFTGHWWIPHKRPVTRSFDVFFVLRLSKRLSKQSSGWWFEMPLCPLWRYCNDHAANTEGFFLSPQQDILIY